MTEPTAPDSRCPCGAWPVCPLPNLCPEATRKLVEWQLRNQIPPSESEDER